MLLHDKFVFVHDEKDKNANWTSSIFICVIPYGNGQIFLDPKKYTIGIIGCLFHG
jgi:hypothetical protein